MIKLIIFDFSKVCFTLEEPLFLKQFARKHNLNLVEFETYYNGLLHQAEIAVLSGTQLWKMVLKKYTIKADIPSLIAEMMEAKEAHQDILDLAKQLRKKYKTCYFTNYNEDYWKKIKQKFDLKPYFDWGIVSYQVKTRKPAVEGFKIILQHFKVMPQQAIFIDDQEKNLVEARKWGIMTIVFKNKKQLLSNLQKQGIKV